MQKHIETCFVCKKSEDLTPFTLGWGEVSAHLKCVDYFSEHLEHFYDRMVQVVDKDNEEQRPFVCHYKCRGCAEEFHYTWKLCIKCGYEEATISERPNVKVAAGRNGYGCNHFLTPTAGPFPNCVACGSIYATWLNYTPRTYLWVNKRNLV